jgi:hypothetical protein
MTKQQLISTNVKGLYLTNEGKAWHKSAKRELTATISGKIRFNGKLYDLQKLIDFSPSKTTRKKAEIKKSVKKTISIRELQKQGFKKTKINGLYITNDGKSYNVSTKKSLSIFKGLIIVNKKAYNLSKLILETFCKIPVRSGQTYFKNGNEMDFYFENLAYKSTIQQKPPNEVDLIKCIRLYFEIDRKTHKRSLLIKYYISEIIKTRHFEYKDKDFDLFLEYYKCEYWILSNNQKAVFDKFNYTAINGKNAINKYLNLLINDCLKDLESGILEIKDFLKPIPTKTQKLKDLQKSINEMGLKIKIPLRKPGAKELLDKFKKRTYDIKKIAPGNK